MIDPAFDEYIKNRGYTASETFNNSTSDLLKLLNYLKVLPVEKESFNVIKDLIKYYRGSIFIAFASFYARLEASPDVSKYEEQAMDIAAFVKGYLGENKLEELNFFYFKGISKKKKKITPRSEGEDQFVRYIQKLGTILANLKKNMNTLNAQDLKLQIDSILAEGLNRKLNTLEQNYQQYFKAQADKIYKQKTELMQKQMPDVPEVENRRKNPESKPEPTSEKVVPMCCRTFFYDQEVIKQPENLFLQYKNYSIPFDETRINILKKTICGFLNTDGGIIFLGIHEKVETKKRKVLGMQLNENDKQNILKTIRMIASDIVPEIIMNKMYAVSFVPLRSSHPPHKYISGRFVTKIVVKYGLRDEIYSYTIDKKDYFSFRTENQVIHREGREVLNAYRERIKNPVPKPAPLHDGPCAIPEKGSEVYEQFRARRGENNENYDKKKYRERDANDFVIMQISERIVLNQLRLYKLQKLVSVTSDFKNQVCFLRVLDQKERDNIYDFIYDMSENFQVHQIQRGILLEQDDGGHIYDIVLDIFNQKQIGFKMDGNLIRLRSTEDAISAFLVLMEMRFRVNFVAI